MAALTAGGNPVERHAAFAIHQFESRGGVQRVEPGEGVVGLGSDLLVAEVEHIIHAQTSDAPDESALAPQSPIAPTGDAPATPQSRDTQLSAFTRILEAPATPLVLGGLAIAAIVVAAAPPGAKPRP